VIRQMVARSGIQPGCRRVPDRAGSRRSGNEQPQSAPNPAEPPGGPLVLYRALMAAAHCQTVGFPHDRAHDDIQVEMPDRCTIWRITAACWASFWPK